MNERTRLIEAVRRLKPQELLRVADFIEALQDRPQTTLPRGNAQPDYQAVRKALATLTTALSAEINSGREDRV